MSETIAKNSTVFVYMKLDFTNVNFTDRLYYLNDTGDVINALYWVFARGSTGDLLVKSPFDFKTLSLGSLSIGVEVISVDVKIIPEDDTDCFLHGSNDTQRLNEIASFLLNLTSRFQSIEQIETTKICQERQDPARFFDQYDFSGIHTLLQSSTSYFCWKSNELLVPFHVDRLSWVYILQWSGLAAALFLPFVALYCLIWKIPPKDYNGETRYALNTDLVPIGLLYTLLYWEPKSRIRNCFLYFCRWMPILFLVSFVPFLPKVIGTYFFQEQLYEDRIKAHDKAAKDLIAKHHEHKSLSPPVPVIYFTLILDICFLYSVTTVLLHYIYITYKSEKGKIKQDSPNVPLIFFVIAKILPRQFKYLYRTCRSVDENPASWKNMYDRSKTLLKIAWYPKLFWEVVKNAIRSYLDTVFSFCIYPRGDTDPRVCGGGLRSKIATCFWFPIWIITAILLGALTIVLIITTWIVAAIPCSWCLSFISFTFIDGESERMMLFRLILLLLGVVGALTFGIIVLALNIVYAVEIIGYTFIGLVINSSFLLPYCSIVVTVLGYLIYSVCSLYDDYHKMYHSIFELAIKVDANNDDDDENRAKLIIMQNDDIPTISSDLFWKLVDRYKPLGEAVTKLVVGRIIPMLVVGIAVFMILNKVDNLKSLSETVNLLSFVFITGAIPTIWYLVQNPSSQICQNAALLCQMKLDMEEYTKTGNLKKRETDTETEETNSSRNNYDNENNVVVNIPIDSESNQVI
ncbi:uncharacterized protein [Amphiura filiformis]|uniref:uncharacterized protein n=1 Tax=Amphiura filiformis TaxID=82378 RepID=UPI003B223D2F